MRRDVGWDIYLKCCVAAVNMPAAKTKTITKTITKTKTVNAPMVLFVATISLGLIIKKKASLTTNVELG